MIKKQNKGASTVIGSVLFIILITSLTSTLFVALYKFNDSSKAALILEESRNQETFEIDKMLTDPEVRYVTAINVNNTGAIAIRIKAVYVDSTLNWEPPDSIAYINAKEASLMTFPTPITFVASSKISIASERGVTTVIREGDFVAGQSPPLQEEDLYFGPLKLDFEKFYYAKFQGNNYPDSEGWISGWEVPKSTELVWKITVKNVDERAITLNKYSCLTLITNGQPRAQRPFYLEKVVHSDDSTSLTIVPQETVTIIYRWSTSEQKNNQSVFSSRAECRVFLTFFGVFNEFGTTKRYGQTIPFEAVLVS